MAATSLLRSLFLCHFSKPAAERLLFRSISRVKPQRIVEIGLAAGDRCLELIELAQRHRPTVEIRYTGMDMFDARTHGVPLSLKSTHQLLKPSGAKIQLIPGDPFQSMSRVANELASTDMLVISGDCGSTLEEPAWYYVPRMLADHAEIYWQKEAEGPFQKLTPLDIKRMNAQPPGRSSKAA